MGAAGDCSLRCLAHGRGDAYHHGMPTVIRDVLPVELPLVLAMNESAVPHVNRIDLAQMQQFHAEAAYFRVALVDGDLAAFLVGLRPDADYHSPNFRWFCARYPDFAYIDRVAVSEPARRRGVAAALYRDFESAFSGLCPCLACEVNLRPANEASMEFHRRIGFRQVGSQTIDDGTKEVAMLVKNLAS